MNLGTFSNSGLGFGLAFSLYDDFTYTARRIEREMLNLQGMSTSLADNVEKGMTRIKMGAMGAMTAIIGLAGFVKAAKVDAQFQRYQLSMETFLGSAQAAQRVFDQIRADALRNPVFEVDALMRANTALMSQGISEEQSRRIVNNLAEILAGAGRGNDELVRMAINLQQIAANGKAFGIDIRQFGYAGVNVMKLLADATGQSASSFEKADVTLNMLDEAFQKAVKPGGQYFGAMEKAASGTMGKMNQLKENITFTWAAIGETIRPVTIKVLEGLNALLSKIQEFSATPFGRWIIIITGALTGMLLVISLLVLATSVGRVAVYRLAGAYSAATKVTILNALATNGMTAALYQMARASLVAVTTASPMLYTMLAIAGVTYIVVRSIGEFNKLMAGGSKPQQGFIGFLQKMGALMMWVGTLWSNYGFDKFFLSKGFNVPTNLLNQMDALGIGNLARNIATWIARIKEFFAGVADGVSTMMHITMAVLRYFADMLGIADDWIGRNTTSMHNWWRIGRMLGIALGTIVALFIGWMALKPILFIGDMIVATTRLVWQFAMMAIQLVEQIALMGVLNAEMLLYNGIGLATIAILGLIGYGIYQLATQHSSNFEGMTRDINGYADAMYGAVSTTGNAGMMMGTSLRDSWDKSLQDWNPFKQITDKWEEFKNWYANNIAGTFVDPYTNTSTFKLFGMDVFTGRDPYSDETKNTFKYMARGDDYEDALLKARKLSNPGYRPTPDYSVSRRPAGELSEYSRKLLGREPEAKQPVVMHNHIYVDSVKVAEQLKFLFDQDKYTNYNNDN